MTYYGRWTYKYEIASEKGAAAAILIHETGPAGYPFEVVRGSWGRENFDIPPHRDDAGATGRVSVEGWITDAKAREILKAAGQDLDALKKAAATPRLPARAARVLGPVRRQQCAADGPVEERHRPARGLRSRAEGRVSGLHGTLGPPRQATPSDPGDHIFNGAADNASGVAAVLEMARAFTRINPPPKRSILFLAVTAEEKGLLGAKYYAPHPLYPLERTLANINLDVINLWGPTKDIISIGMGQTTLDDLLVEIAGAARPDGRARRRPGEGLLLPLGPLRVRQAGRARARSQGRPPVRRQVGRLRQAEARRVHREGLSQAERRGETGLGPLRRRRGPEAPGRARLSSLPRTRSTPSGSRGASSGPGARPCSRPRSRDREQQTAAPGPGRSRPALAVGAAAIVAAWLDVRYGWIDPAFDVVAHQFYEVPLLAQLRRPSQLVLVRWHLGILASYLTLGLAVRPWLSRHARAWVVALRRRLRHPRGHLDRREQPAARPGR